MNTSAEGFSPEDAAQLSVGAIGALDSVLNSLRIGTWNREWMRTHYGSEPLLQPLNRSEFRDPERRELENESIQKTARGVAAVHQHAYEARSMASHAEGLSSMSAALNVPEVAPSASQLRRVSGRLNDLARELSGLSLEADRILDDSIEALTEGRSDTEITRRLADLTEQSLGVLSAARHEFEAACRTAGGVAALHEPGTSGEEPLWDAALGGMSYLDLSTSQSAIIDVRDRSSLEIELTGLAARLMRLSNDSVAAAITIGDSADRGLAVYCIEADTYIQVEGGRQPWTDSRGSQEDQRRLTDLGFEFSEEEPPGWNIQLATRSASEVGRFLTATLFDHHEVEPADQLAITTGEYSFRPMGGPVESITSVFDVNRINDAAGLATQAWLTGLGLCDAINDVRTSTDTEPIPVPGLGDALTRLMEATTAGCDTADLIGALDDPNSDPETIAAISSAAGRAMDAALDSQAAMRQLAQLCLGVTALLEWNSTVARAERAAVVTLVESAVPLAADSDMLALVSRSPEELYVELAGILSRIVLEHDTALTLTSTSATAFELILTTDSTGVLTLTYPAAEASSDSIPDLVEAGWNTDHTALVATWPNDLTVIEPVELIVATLRLMEITDPTDLRLAVSVVERS